MSSEGITNTGSGSTSVVQNGLEPAGMVFFVVVLMSLVSFAACAYMHSHRRVRAGLPLLWALTFVLWAGVVLGAASIGVLLLPAALLAVVTSVVGNLVQARTGTAGQS